MSTFGVRLFFVKSLLRRVKNAANYHNIPRARAGFEKAVGKFNTHMSGFAYQEILIGNMKCEWITPNVCDPTKVLLYFHGGGYATGSVNTHRALVSKLAEHAHTKALVIEYRLAPENKYPAPIQDAHIAYEWLLQNGYKPENIAFGGDSAGGGVTIGTLYYLRDNKVALPKCAIAISPWLDLTLSGESYHHKKDHDPMLVHEAFPIWVANYLGSADPTAPYASPVFHQPTGLPPIYIQVGEEEMLLDDSIRFAEKCKAAGVSIKLEVYPKKFHVFNAFWRVLPKAREANKKLGEFIKEQLGG
jgi:epsilon-lactone hydrolase